MKKQTNEWAALERALNGVIGKIISINGWSKTELAKRTGIAQPTISDIMSDKAKGRTWTASQLCKVAEVLGLRLSELICIAECGGVNGMDDIQLRLIETEPCSNERLDCIIKLVAPAGVLPDVLNLYYTVEMMGIASSSVVERYLCGAIGDHEVFDMLKSVHDSLEEGRISGGKSRQCYQDNNSLLLFLNFITRCIWQSGCPVVY